MAEVRPKKPGKPALQQFAQAPASLYLIFSDTRRIIFPCAANLLVYLEGFLKEIHKIV